MSFRVDHDYHIHSQLSACSSDPKQSTESILQYALDNGLRTIVLTDHYWDNTVPGPSDWYRPQDFAHIAQSRPLPQHESCRFLFGCETDMNRFGVVGIPEERYDDFDFIIVPTTHLHMPGFTRLDDGERVQKRAATFVKRFEQFLSQSLPYHKVGLAHITCPLIMRKDNMYVKVLDTVTDAQFANLFSGCAEKGCGVEINVPLSQLTDEAIRESCLRPYRIAKAQGCRFYFGSDAHHPGDFDGVCDKFRLAADMLQLTADDQFIIGG